MNLEKRMLPHQREPCKHLNHGTMEDPQYYNNPKLQLCNTQLATSQPIQLSDFPLWILIKRKRFQLNQLKQYSLLIHQTTQNINANSVQGRERVSKKHTMEQMLSESIIRHELSNKEPLISVTTITNQIRQPIMPQLPHTPCFFLKTLQDSIKKKSNG